MVELHKIDHVKYSVKNLDEFVDFYVQKLGFQIIGPSKDVIEAKKYIMLKKGEIGIDVQVPMEVDELTNSDKDHMGFVHMAFKVSDVQRSYAELVRKGVEFLGKPELNPDNGRTIAFFKDPEGNILHLTD